MSYVRVWIHAVWGTKRREPILEKGVRQKLFSHIVANAASKRLFVDTVNGYLEHVHCLFALNADISIGKALQLIKGEASHWFNIQDIAKSKLEWADEYYAVSVSESDINRVRHYIRTQEEHHRTKSFADECQKFLDEYGFTKSHG